MTQLTADFEKGTNGNNVLTSDPGSANAWDAVNLGAGATATYDNVHAAHGTLACKSHSNNTNLRLEWSTSFGTSTDWYGRIYCYLTTDPGSQQLRFFDIADNGGVRACAFDFTNPGAGTGIRILDTSSASVGQGTVAPGLNKWIRVEVHVHNSTTTGQCEAKLFNTADSTTADETITTASNINTNTLTGRIWAGDAQGSTIDYWIDDILVGASSYPGPAIPPATGPPVAPILMWP